MICNHYIGTGTKWYQRTQHEKTEKRINGMSPLRRFRCLCCLVHCTSCTSFNKWQPHGPLGARSTTINPKPALCPMPRDLLNMGPCPKRPRMGEGMTLFANPEAPLCISICSFVKDWFRMVQVYDGPVTSVADWPTIYSLFLSRRGDLGPPNHVTER